MTKMTQNFQACCTAYAARHSGLDPESSKIGRRRIPHNIDWILKQSRIESGTEGFSKDDKFASSIKQKGFINAHI